MSEIRRDAISVEKIAESISVLVVGDWIIDEDWVMMPERSETSAKQSDEKHFHTAFTEVDVATKRLCGASLTASVIRGFFKSREKAETKGLFNVFGMGVWHPQDDNNLEVLFQEDALKGANPFRISSVPVVQTKPDDKRLFNLAREGDKCSTNRVVRSYIGHPGTLPRSMSRYDWHLDWKTADGEKPIAEIVEKRVDENFKSISNQKIQFDAIVLADFNKGLLNKDLILSIKSGLKKYNLCAESCTWFLRSKQIGPIDWSKELNSCIRNQDRFVKFIDPRITKKRTDGKNMIYGAELTKDGLDFVNWNRNTNVPNSKLAILFHDNQCIAFENLAGDGKSYIWILDANEKAMDLTRGRSSVFLASLVIQELPEKKRELLQLKPPTDFGANCSIALNNGVKWCQDCLAIWKNEPHVLRVSANINSAIQCTEYPTTVKISPKMDFNTTNIKWNTAINKEESCCINGPNNEPRLEVWRAHTVLNDYTLLDPGRKTTVLNLMNTVRTFLDEDEKERVRPMISLMKAGPGSGKTFLARCVAKQFKLELMECNVAQQTSLDGLAYFFDQIDIAQREGRRVLMFLDEVDALVNNESTFGFLLDFLWCGQFFRNGMKRILKPFPGILAMSRDDSENDFKSDHPKYKDLKSRIFGINMELDNITKEENVYLFAKLIDKYFGQISHVEKGVLQVIQNTEYKNGPRSLEMLMSLFKGIKRNQITHENLPDASRIKELNEHFPTGLYLLPKGNNGEELPEYRKMVDIIYNPPTF